MRLILLGSPGSGKGTASCQLADSLGVPRIVTSELLKDQIKKGTEIGQTMSIFMDRGDLVPDNLVISVVMDSITPLVGFILDGFPRTLGQAKALKSKLHELGKPIDKVLFLDVSFETAKARNLKRFICKACGFSPMPHEAICSRCGGDLTKRADDNEDAITRRFHNYIRDTQPLVDFYKSEGILLQIDANLSVEEMSIQLLEALGLQ
jgi:adenylate kinase